jgi:hypothetical protein
MPVPAAASLMRTPPRSLLVAMLSRLSRSRRPVRCPPVRSVRPFRAMSCQLLEYAGWLTSARAIFKGSPTSSARTCQAIGFAASSTRSGRCTHGANQRELASHDPAADIVLPPVNAKPRERIATPKKMVAPLGALERKDAVPYALAAYSWARRAQIERLRWEEVDLKVGLVEWGADEENARKSEAAKHVVPLLRPCGGC